MQGTYTLLQHMAILVTGADFNITHVKLKDMMLRNGGVMEWAKMHNCSFGIEKFQLLDLTKQKVKDPMRPQKRIPQPRVDLILNGQRIKSTMTVKFLGLHIDRELKWKEQIAAAIGKGRECLRQCNRLVKILGGVPGQQLRRLYLTVIKPRILYGADIFLGPIMHSNTIKTRKGGCMVLNKLAAIQRSAALLSYGNTQSFQDRKDVENKSRQESIKSGTLPVTE